MLVTHFTRLSADAASRIVFSDDFNAYAFQGGWTPPTNWTAPGPGTVDLIGETTSGNDFDLYPGNGGFVDLDGSNQMPGELQTIASFAAGTYTLTFDLGGNARGDIDKTTLVTLGSFSTSITLPSDSPLQLYAYTFETTGGDLSFQDLPGGNQDIGNILDNVTLSTTNPPCFAAGTRLETPGGTIAVETLRPGDTVSTTCGAAQIRWIGHRRAGGADLTRFHPHALGPNVPHRDLYVSSDHAMFVGGVLVPAGLLENGLTITHEQRDVTLYHVELDTHAILRAEGAPAESYLDTGNRRQFSNCRMGYDPIEAASSDPCAEMIVAGPRLAKIKASLMPATV